MKLFSSILFSLFFLSARGQQVKFELYRINPCTGIETLDVYLGSYYLTDDEGNNFSPTDLSGLYDSTIILPKPGKYYLHIDEYDNPQPTPIVLNIKDTGLFIYHYKEPKIIYKYFAVIEPYYAYTNCDTLAEGYTEDFYPNGKIRLRGNFKKGNVKDSLTLFYANGNIAKKISRSHKKLQTEIFDSSNHLRTVYQTSNKYRGVYLPECSSTKVFFPNGHIALQESENNKHKSRTTLTKEYFENGNPKIIQTKNYRMEYYENGNKKIVYTWKHKKDKDLDVIFKVYKRSYDENNNLIEEIEFEDWVDYIDSPPNLDLSRSDWIDKWIVYKNGKKIIKAEDDDPKKYF